MAQFRSEIKDVGAAFYAGSGNNTRSWVHIDDLMTIYLRLVESAVAGGGSASWGKEVSFRSVTRFVADMA